MQEYTAVKLLNCPRFLLFRESVHLLLTMGLQPGLIKF